MRSIPMVSNFISLVKIDPIICLASEKSMEGNVNSLLIDVLQLAYDGTSKTIGAATVSIINEIRLHPLVMGSEGRELIAVDAFRGPMR